MHASVSPHSTAARQLEATIARAEILCARCRLALQEPELAPRALRHRRKALLIAEATLARLKADRLA